MRTPEEMYKEAVDLGKRLDRHDRGVVLQLLKDVQRVRDVNGVLLNETRRLRARLGMCQNKLAEARLVMVNNDIMPPGVPEGYTTHRQSGGPDA